MILVDTLLFKDPDPEKKQVTEKSRILWIRIRNTAFFLDDLYITGILRELASIQIKPLGKKTKEKEKKKKNVLCIHSHD